MKNQDSRVKAEAFLKISDQFKLGDLPTEMPHPATSDLSRQSVEDLPAALQLLKQIDLQLLEVMESKLPEVEILAAEIRDTLDTGGNIFISGCGSTGRLALALETIWRSLHPEKDLRDRVTGFMAGGDLALIKAVEEFEDFTDYGARQLMDLGFAGNDLLLAVTEGGETPFVIGTAWQAAEVSVRKPYFLYCNPDEILRAEVDRSREVIESDKIVKMNLSVGPMGISGSTRMQATTIQMLAAGLALVGRDSDSIRTSFRKLCAVYLALDIELLAPFTEEESRIYSSGNYLFYEASEKFAITILTDTTERAPTFSLYPFENQLDREKDTFNPCLCYLVLPEASNAPEGYRMLLGRDPRTVEWPELGGAINTDRLYGHDFSRYIVTLRKSYLKENSLFTFSIREQGYTVVLELDNNRLELDFKELDVLSEHIVLKMLLNIHSTLVMGRLGRYEGNLMTWLRSSNNKLIDRTIRYAGLLLAGKGIDADYEEVCYACFAEMETIRPDQPIVLHTVKRVIEERGIKD
jgi:N-acetylmuramic acid 6-phosphate etherase